MMSTEYIKPRFQAQGFIHETNDKPDLSGFIDCFLNHLLHFHSVSLYSSIIQPKLVFRIPHDITI